VSAADNAAIDDEPKRTTIVEERGPIDPELDLPAHGENLLCVQQHSAAADVDSRGIAAGLIHKIPGADVDRETLVPPALPRLEPGSRTCEHVDLIVKL
jgi:hypothetical protein